MTSWPVVTGHSSRCAALVAAPPRIAGYLVAGALFGPSALGTLLTAGFVAENVSERHAGEAFRTAMERSAAPVFVVFFALAGASLALSTLSSLWMLVIPIVLVRLLAIGAGTWLGARWGRASSVERRYVWLGLVSQAGVAIGLATIVAQAYRGLPTDRALLVGKLRDIESGRETVMRPDLASSLRSRS